MVLLRIGVLVVLAGCATPPAAVGSGEEAAVEPTQPTDTERILEGATLEQQERELLFQRRYAQARALWKAQRLDEALEAVEHALLLQPKNAEAKVFRDELRRDLGYRDGSVSTLMNEEAARYSAQLEEERLSVERLIAKAERAQRAGNWAEARRNYEAALFVLRTSRFHESDGYAELRKSTADRRKALGREERAAEKARRERETAAALAEIERQDESDR